MLKLRASRDELDDTYADAREAKSLLSHTLPIARQTLRMAYWAVAKEVHPDRLHTPLAMQAMSVLNEAYRQAVLRFSPRDPTNEVIRLDMLGLEHALIH